MFSRAYRQERIQKVKDLLQNDPELTSKEIACITGFNSSTIGRYRKILGEPFLAKHGARSRVHRMKAQRFRECIMSDLKRFLLKDPNLKNIELADLLEVDRSTVVKYRKLLGEEFRFKRKHKKQTSRARKVLKAKREEEITRRMAVLKRLLIKDPTLKDDELGEILGCHRSTVSEYRRRLGPQFKAVGSRYRKRGPSREEVERSIKMAREEKRKRELKRIQRMRENPDLGLFPSSSPEAVKVRLEELDRLLKEDPEHSVEYLAYKLGVMRATVEGYLRRKHARANEAIKKLDFTNLNQRNMASFYREALLEFREPRRLREVFNSAHEHKPLIRNKLLERAYTDRIFSDYFYVLTDRARELLGLPSLMRARVKTVSSMVKE